MKLIPNDADPIWDVRIQQMHNSEYTTWNAKVTVYISGVKVFLQLKSSELFEDYDSARLDWVSFASNNNIEYAFI